MSTKIYKHLDKAYHQQLYNTFKYLFIITLKSIANGNKSLYKASQYRYE